MRVRKIVLWIGIVTILGIVSSGTLIYANVWMQNSRYFPPEQVYVKVASPDGEKLALFSIKYQSFSPWLPDYEPYAYVTVIETEHGSILLRETAHYGAIKQSFAELAKKHAPWAVEPVTDLEW